jgi:hypothetical protein
MPSTVIDHFVYTKKLETLRIIFNSGNIYIYKDVPEEVYILMTKSTSKGKFFNQYIKDHYDFEKMESEA